MEKGKFIVFEGLDKSGKSTQFNKFCDYLKYERGLQICRINSPSPLDTGKKIRDVLTGREECSPELLRIMFVYDKMYTWEYWLAPMIEEGTWVISHRWVLSTLSYGVADGFYTGWLMNINAHVKVPDLTIFIDTPPDECIRRLYLEGCEAEKYENLAKLQKAYDNYQWMLDHNPFASPNIKVSGIGDKDEIHKEIVQRANEVFR